MKPWVWCFFLVWVLPDVVLSMLFVELEARIYWTFKLPQIQFPAFRRDLLPIFTNLLCYFVNKKTALVSCWRLRFTSYISPYQPNNGMPRSILKTTCALGIFEKHPFSFYLIFCRSFSKETMQFRRTLLVSKHSLLALVWKILKRKAHAQMSIMTTT